MSGQSFWSVSTAPPTEPVQLSGTTGTDASANGATIPMPGLVLLATLAALPSRSGVTVQNQSLGQIQVVRDDGTGNNQTTIMLAPAATAGGSGAMWTSQTFKGRVRVYGAAGAQVALCAE